MANLDDLDQRPESQRPQRGCLPSLTAFGIFGGVMVAVCCGGCGALFYFLFVPNVVETAAEIDALSQEIVDIKVPDDFEPDLAMKWDNWLFTARICAYRQREGRGALQLMEVMVKLGDKAPAEAKLREAMSQQDSIKEIKVLEVKSSEEREFTIRGQPVKLTFAEGEDVSSSTGYHQVSGQFAGKNGPATLILQLEDAAWDEAAVVEMLESMR